MIGMVIPRPVRQDDVGLPFADQAGDLLARLEIRHQLAVVDVEDVRLDAELLVARRDLGLAPLRQRAARLREVSDVAVGQRHQLDLVSLRGHQRCRAPELQLGIVWMRAERDDAQRAWRGRLGGEMLNAGSGQRENQAADDEFVRHGKLLGGRV